MGDKPVGLKESHSHLGKALGYLKRGLRPVYRALGKIVLTAPSEGRSVLLLARTKYRYRLMREDAEMAYPKVNGKLAALREELIKEELAAKAEDSIERIELSKPLVGAQQDVDRTHDPRSMKIRDMEFGSVDANNEFGNIDTELFQSLFCVYPGFNLKKLLEGKIRFICGDKGTGKTMLLRYAEVAARERGCATVFVKYKREVTDVDRQEMARAASHAGRIDENDENEASGESRDVVVTNLNKASRSNNVDYTMGWKLYLINLIVSRCKDLELPIFDNGSKCWQELVDLLGRAYGGDDSSNVQRLLPEMQRGQVTLKLGPAEVGVEYSAKPRQDGPRISFPKLAQKAIDLYKGLPVRDNLLPFYIFIDEIELSYITTRYHDREARFIGDLIRAVDELDDVSRDRGVPVRIVLALRNQVLDTVSNVGFELNKEIEDYGTQIDWRRRAGDSEESPLLEIIERRVACNLSENDQRRENIWDSFFPPKVGRLPIKKYILNQTWFKPRDVVRLLKTLQGFCGNAERFDEKLFISIRSEYAKLSWREIEEELSAKYQRDFIEGVARVLNGIKCPFSFQDFNDKFDQEKNNYATVKQIAKSYSALEVLETLFDFGVVGNVGGRDGEGGVFRFSAFGEVTMAQGEPFTVHYPLRSRFAIR